MTETAHDYNEVTTCQTVSAILWPSFLSAGLLTVLAFAFFDPIEFLGSHGIESISRTGAYSLGFFSFWLATAISSFGTRYFLKPCESVNRT